MSSWPSISSCSSSSALLLSRDGSGTFGTVLLHLGAAELREEKAQHTATKTHNLYMLWASQNSKESYADAGVQRSHSMKLKSKYKKLYQEWKK